MRDDEIALFVIAFLLFWFLGKISSATQQTAKHTKLLLLLLSSSNEETSSQNTNATVHQEVKDFLDGEKTENWKLIIGIPVIVVLAIFALGAIANNVNQF